MVGVMVHANFKSIPVLPSVNLKMTIHAKREKNSRRMSMTMPLLSLRLKV
jgi:hypothetical protein